MSDHKVDGDLNGFPAASLLPKEDTQSAQFIRDHPEYDGRGVIVAVFDTGCDVGAAGMQITSDGKPKYVDFVDATGSGDVNTSSIVVANSSGEIALQSGRIIRPLEKWNNPSGQWRVGLKEAYSFFPDSLIDRLKKERKKKWDEEMRSFEGEFNRQIATFDSSPTSITSIINTSESSPVDKKKQKADIEAKLSELKSLMGSWEDHGPIFDVIAFHDGNTWRAVVIPTELSDLSSLPALAPYKLERQYATFSGIDMMNYTVNIYDDGAVVSLVIAAGSHGTHVAGILAANFPDNPILNGVAPGAQIVSVKIGDSRLGTMETATGLVRGLIAAQEWKVDAINMSYGEATAAPTQGKFVELAMEIVNKFKIIFVSSAGNNGPALTTTGSPGGTEPGIWGIGAYVSPPMMESEYSLRKQMPETQYTWSSRGPTTDGALGVFCAANGGAITSVPQWCLAQSQLMNGTSMASPNACGCIALLLSALKANKISYSPQSIRSAIENTARPIESVDKFAQGAGLIQVSESWRHLQSFSSLSDAHIQYKISLKGTENRGIYLRELGDVNRSYETSVTVTPLFPEAELKEFDQHDDEAVRQVNESKIALQVPVKLRVDYHSASKNWVESPGHVWITGARTFALVVRPETLPAGVHYAEIVGIDTSHEDRGSIFRVPITVVRPETIIDTDNVIATTSPTLAQYRFRSLPFENAAVHRKFIALPAGATSVDLLIRGHKIDTQREFMLHAVYLMPEQPYRQFELDKYFALQNDDELSYSIDVVGNVMLEICLAQYWSSVGASEVDIEVTVRSLHGNDDTSYTFDGSTGIYRIDLDASLKTEALNPTISLKSLHQSVRPSSAVISPLSKQRDMLWGNRQLYQCVLTYHWQAFEDGKVLPHASFVEGRLYECALLGQLFMLFDSNKRLIGTGDAFESHTNIRVKKGKYTLRLQLTYDDANVLEKFKDLIVRFETQLQKPVELNVYPTYNAAVLNNTKFGDRRLLKSGCRRAIFVPPIDQRSLPAYTKAGDVLVGTIQFGKASGYGSRAGSYKFRYLIPPPPNPEKKTPPKELENKQETEVASPVALSSDTNESKEGVSKNGDDFDASVEQRDMQINYIKSLNGKKRFQAYNAFFPSLLQQFPSHLPLLSLRVDIINDKLKEKSSPSNTFTINDLISACDSLIACINTNELSSHYGRILDKDDPSSTKKRKQMDEIRDHLTNALSTKLNAYADYLKDAIKKRKKSDAGDEITKDISARLTQMRAVYNELGSWLDLNTKENKKTYLNALLIMDQLSGFYGSMLKTVNTEISSYADPASIPASLIIQRIEIFELLGWTKWAKYEKTWNILRFPKDYTLF